MSPGTLDKDTDERVQEGYQQGSLATQGLEENAGLREGRITAKLGKYATSTRNCLPSG